MWKELHHWEENEAFCCDKTWRNERWKNLPRKNCKSPLDSEKSLPCQPSAPFPFTEWCWFPTSIYLTSSSQALCCCRLPSLPCCSSWEQHPEHRPWASHTCSLCDPSILLFQTQRIHIWSVPSDNPYNTSCMAGSSPNTAHGRSNTPLQRGRVCASLRYGLLATWSHRSWKSGKIPGRKPMESF